MPMGLISRQILERADILHRLYVKIAYFKLFLKPSVHQASRRLLQHLAGHQVNNLLASTYSLVPMWIEVSTLTKTVSVEIVGVITLPVKA